MTGKEFNAIRQQSGLSLNQLGRLLRYENVRALRDMAGGDKEISGPISVLMELLRDGRLDDLAEAAREPSFD